MDKQTERERSDLIKTVESLIEGPIIFLGFLWMVLIVIELVWGLSPALQYTSITIWIIFIIDFLFRFIIAPRKIQYLKKNWLTALSLVIPAIRLFRVLRVLRMVRGIRLIRVVSSLNRSMKSLAATMQRRGFAYVALLALIVIFGGAAGMYGIENATRGFESYGMALWWTAMRVITAGSDYWPATPEGRSLAFILSLFGYAVFGYVTATLATFFIGRDAEELDAPLAGSREVEELKQLVLRLEKKIDSLNKE